MKAAVLVGFGGVDQLVVRDVPEPEIRAGAVKVRVVATSINPIDWKLREGAVRPGLKLELPTILGRDAAGEIIEVGEGVTRLRVGMRVAGLVMGGYGERVVADEASWAEIPGAMGFEDAAAVPLVALTGSQLVAALALRSVDVMVVTGALGSVGHAAVFTAKATGAHVWAAVRAAQQKAVEMLGIEGVVPLDAEIGSAPTFDAIADTVGAGPVQQLLDQVRAGGRLASVVSEPPDAKERGLIVQHVWAHPDHERLAVMLRAVADGLLVIPIAKRFSLSQIREAHESAQRGAGGKVIVRIGA